MKSKTFKKQWVSSILKIGVISMDNNKEFIEYSITDRSIYYNDSISNWPNRMIDKI